MKASIRITVWVVWSEFGTESVETSEDAAHEVVAELRTRKPYADAQIEVHPCMFVVEVGS